MVMVYAWMAHAIAWLVLVYQTPLESRQVWKMFVLTKFACSTAAAVANAQMVIVSVSRGGRGMHAMSRSA